MDEKVSNNKVLNIKTGSLKQRPDIQVHNNEAPQRVFELDGRFYVEIRKSVNVQRFVSEMLDELGILTCRIYKYKTKEGETIYVSSAPKLEDFNYKLNGKIVGWANIFLIAILFGDMDHNVEKSMSDTILFLDEGSAINLEIVLGNIFFYDYNFVSMSKKPFEWMVHLFDIKETDLDILFDSREIEYISLERFKLDMYIYLFSEIKRLTDLLDTQGEKIVRNILKKLKYRKVPDEKITDEVSLVSLLKERLSQAERIVSKKISLI